MERKLSGRGQMSSPFFEGLRNPSLRLCTFMLRILNYGNVKLTVAKSSKSCCKQSVVMQANLYDTGYFPKLLFASDSSEHTVSLVVSNSGLLTKSKYLAFDSS